MIELHRPGIEPGTPASQAGTLPKELSRHFLLWVSYTPLTRNNTQQHTRTPNNRQQHTTTVHNSIRLHKNTNVPLFKKLWDLIFFCGTITLWALSGDILKMSLEMAHKVIVTQKKIMSRSFLNSGTLIVIGSCLSSLYSYLSLSLESMDEGTIKTQNPKCRLYLCLIKFIDWRYSQSC